MGEYKDINDQLYKKLMEELEDEGYADISSKENDEIVNLINCNVDFQELFRSAKEVIKKSRR